MNIKAIVEALTKQQASWLGGEPVMFCRLFTRQISQIQPAHVGCTGNKQTAMQHIDPVSSSDATHVI
jgi:hypothetical protein